MSERNELAAFGQLVTGLFAQFPQCDLLDCFCRYTVGTYSVVDLSGWHFPNRCADWDAFLMNQNDFAVSRHWRNNHCRFAMHNCPCPLLRARGCPHAVSYDLDMRIRQVIGAPPKI